MVYKEKGIQVKSSEIAYTCIYTVLLQSIGTKGPLVYL